MCTPLLVITSLPMCSAVLGTTTWAMPFAVTLKLVDQPVSGMLTVPVAGFCAEMVSVSVWLP